jgi:urease accessory protein
MESASSEGWPARLHLDFERRGGRTILARKRQLGPLTVQRPFYPEDGACHVYLLHPPGGVVGGDQLDIEVDVREGAHALVTTPGAAKFYRSAGPQARQRLRLRVHQGGVLEWFPQESILFPGARLDSHHQIELRGSAHFLGWEIQSLGRPVIGERFTSGTADLGFAVLREGRPLLAERLRLHAEGDLDGPSGLRGYPVGGTFLATASTGEDLKVCRDALQPSGELLVALTRVEDLLVGRCLAGSVEPVHQIFSALWGILRPRLLDCEARRPRIWAT